MSPAWVAVLANAGWDAVHWSEVGDPRAPDPDVLAWARDRKRVVLTHDLDFGAMLALTGGTGPSVIQVRTHDILPASLGSRLVKLLRQFEADLENGAIIVVDEWRHRVRHLPLTPRNHDV